MKGKVSGKNIESKAHKDVGVEKNVDPALRQTWAYGHRILISRIFVAGLLGIWAVSSPAWHDQSRLLAHAVAGLGIALATVGAFGRLWCSSYISGNKNNRLVTTGPYSLCRNPLYYFTFVGGVGVTLTTETATLPALFIAAFRFYYPGVIRAEEHSLQLLHGDAFEDYRGRVPGFWPAFSAYQESARYEISPASFRRSLCEVGWFIAAALTIHFVDDLSAAAPFAAWLKLY